MYEGGKIPFVAHEAIAPGLRVKHHSTAGEVAIAGDEQCIGTAYNRAYADQDPITVYDINNPGTQRFVANGAITAGASVSSAAGGKVQTGTSGVQFLGKARTSTTADGEEIQVDPDPGLAGTISRASIVQQDDVPYTIPLTSLRVHDAMQTSLPGTAANDDMGLITGTPGTDVPTLQGVDFGGTTTDEKGTFEFALPAEYVSGQSITVRVRGAMLTTVSDGTATVDVECWNAGGDGAASADLCSTAAQSINSLTPANKDFVITPTSRAPGDRLLVRVAFAGSDTGNVGVMIPEITNIAVLLDIKG